MYAPGGLLGQHWLGGKFQSTFAPHPSRAPSPCMTCRPPKMRTRKRAQESGSVLGLITKYRDLTGMQTRSDLTARPLLRTAVCYPNVTRPPDQPSPAFVRGVRHVHRQRTGAVGLPPPAVLTRAPSRQATIVRRVNGKQRAGKAATRAPAVVRKVIGCSGPCQQLLSRRSTNTMRPL
ncbi:hypothetical protein LZ31DRAFT_231107 [Colletotrichum somersetense]|nr:hypothetical protein LZ31DRAFT_231107 [Colletotrichum somersetense]